MATIQIADKPTLDAVKALLERSGGVKGYPNTTLKVLTGANNSISVTGKGRFTVLGGTYPCIISNLDGIETSTEVFPGATVYFEKNVTLKHKSTSVPVLIQLTN